jgi:general secretion pathway protein D
MREGRYEEGIARLEQAIQARPGDLGIRTALVNARELAMNRMLAAASAEQAAGRVESAGQFYQRVLRIDPGNERANAAVAAIERDRRHAGNVREAREVWAKGNNEGAWSRVQSVLRENPANGPARELKRQIEEQRARELASLPVLAVPSAASTVNLNFRDANLRLVLEALSGSSGIAFVFDRDVKPDLRTTIVARDTSFEHAINLVLMTNQLEKKVLNRNTILIYPATAQKIREYQDLVVKGFYLTNADVKQTQNLIKTVIKAKDTFIDEKMNLLVMRDTPDAIRLAEKLIAMHDLAVPEVMLDVEVLEVQRNKLIEMGIQFPNQLTLSALPSGVAGTALTFTDIKNINADRIGATLSNAIINLKRESGVIDLLANPRIRSLNHEKAKILIGDKVPVITTTSSATGFASQSVQYLDVGLKLEMEPSIYLQDEVAIKIALEVSNITNQIQTSSGVLTYQIGTRSASSVLRLKDGETQVLAGLINDQDRRTASGIPGLADLPIAGRLFRSQKDDLQKTEIVLSITPHLIRNMTLPDPSSSEFLSGTEAALRSPMLLASTGADSGPLKAGDSLTINLPATAPGQVIQLATSTVNLAWDGPQQVKAGEKFKVGLMAKAAGPVQSLPLQLGYDANALEVVEVTEGPFFRQGDAKSSFASNVDAAGGRIFVGSSRSGQDGVSGEAVLFSVTFRSKVPKSKSELRLLAVTALGPSGSPSRVIIPSPLVVSIGN